MTLGQRLRALRISRDLRVCDLSAITGLSKYAIRTAELDKSNPTLLTLKCLADALGVSLDYLMGCYDDIDAEALALAIHKYRIAEYRLIPAEVAAALNPIIVAAERVLHMAGPNRR